MPGRTSWRTNAVSSLSNIWNFHSTMAVLAATGVVLGAVYMLWSYQRVFFGKVTKPENEKLKDVTTTEMTFAMPMVVLIFLLGVAPGWFLNRTEDAVRQGLANSLVQADVIQASNAARAEAQKQAHD